VIADFESVDPVAGRTSLDDEESVVADVLLRYVWNPWQALYVGYTSGSRDLRELDGGAAVDSTERGRQFFVKMSYLFQP